jgi:metal-responsive CopG/Arc/MetJ family transcriptional regulator
MMKARVTLTLDPECVEFLDELARRRGTSRSAALEALLREQLLHREEEELDRLAQEFFAEAETAEEAAERCAWEKLSLEVLSRDGDEAVD